MSENQPSKQKTSFGAQTKWLLGIFFRPRKTFHDIEKQASGVWFLPLLLMSISAIAYAGVSAHFSASFTPANMQEINTQSMESDSLIMEVPSGDEDWQNGASGSQQTSVSPTTFGLLGGIGGVLRVWGSWLIISAVLHLSLTLFGGRMESSRLPNVVSWAGLPLALRDLVRIVGVSLTHKVILHPGLSGLFPANAGGASLFFSTLLGLLDIYLFYSLGLLVLGGKTASGLSVEKSLKAVLIPILILLALYALAGAGTHSLIQQIKEGASFVEDF